ncbi:MAG: SDR family NAD(P)-dependent oxidoreductase [Acidobacteria bacterium]|nr:SDR family NAD(P)-dependent oxidoreductase [Acidobacteriota bacterium]
MRETAHRAVAIVGVGAVLPDAPNARTFWKNIREGRYSISDVHPSRWDPDIYYDPDPKAPDKTYSKIGGWVREWEWDPLKWRLPIPPKVSAAMDLTQIWAVVVAREALADYGYPSRKLDPERTAVILGNAMAGDNHLYSAARVLYAENLVDLVSTHGFSSLPANTQQAILAQLHERKSKRLPEITEDTMPGELANIIAGRIAALYDFKGPNFVADAACASAMAGLSAAVEGLVEGNFDAVLTGGIDGNMSPSTFVKFCKIGALSATGSRPYAEGADGFVMGEGAVMLLLKRLAHAERDGDRIYAVIRGIGGSSDGRGKGITAPNPIGQKLCILRAWENAGVSPTAGDLVEGHGTSTAVGDLAEAESIFAAFAGYGLPKGSIALGSVKSNIGHLKGAAGAAGILKAVFAIHEKVLPPSINFRKPNPGIDFANSPLYVNTELRQWDKRDGVRRAGVSAFGFGGANFHVVLEEYIPGRIRSESKESFVVPEAVSDTNAPALVKTPLRGALVVGAENERELISRVKAVEKEAAAGKAPVAAPPSEAALRAPVRLAIDYGDAAELADKCGKALKAFEENQAGRWKALRAKGIFLGKGPAPKVAFLFAGQGSQYVNMLKALRETESIVAETHSQADRVMQPLLGRPLSEYIYKDKTDGEAMAAAEQDLKQTAITQPAVLATETALARLLGAYGVFPDMVMGHSLGEYGALVASGALSFEEALKAVSARGSEMTKCALEDNGIMAAVFGPIAEVEKILAKIDGYVVIANINSTKEAVIGGATEAVRKAMEAVREAGYVARQLQVSHAFHTKIVAPASEALTEVLRTMEIRPPRIPTISNVTGEFYPAGADALPRMIELLGKQVASPVQFVRGLHTLYEAGARVFVEVGPKRVLYGFVEDVLGDREGVVSLFTNHPRIGEAASFNLALCGLYAAGLGAPRPEAAALETPEVRVKPTPVAEKPAVAPSISEPKPAQPAFELRPARTAPSFSKEAGDRYVELGRLFAEFLERGMRIYSGGRPAAVADTRVGVTGASLGLPGVEGVFDDGNPERILRGGQFIEKIPMRFRNEMVEKNITRLVKTGSGEGRFETIEDLADVIKLAARGKDLDINRDFGFPEDRLPALDRVTKLAIGAGIDALRDAGIPLVMRHKTTTRGTTLPDRWMLPEEMRDDTGVIFTSAFPGCDSFEEIISGFYRDRIRKERLEELNAVRAKALESGLVGNGALAEIDRRISDLRAEIERNPYHFDRRFLFRVLSMGHSQFAEYIGARGPNTATNSACASGTQAVAIAADWIKTGRCRRVIVISADDITSDNLMGWFGSGFLASGSAATDETVEDAAIPFDRRRHGLIVGMGAAAIVVESLESARERGIQPICEVLGSVIANSAFHGSRLDVNHICGVMEKLIAGVEAEWGINRFEIAPQMVFVSHETYTPARGGSASAEVLALRHVFKDAVDQIIVANTKGATGHPMAVGIEDVVAVKILETGLVPPVANFKEVDPELGPLNLSKGGYYPVQYALRLGAGFGSQIAMTLLRWVPTPDGQRRPPSQLGFSYRIADPDAWNTWLQRMTGYNAPELEVVQRTLRVRDQGPSARLVNGATATRPATDVRTPLMAVQPVPTAAPAIPAAATAAAKEIPPAAPVEAAAEDPVKVKVMQIVAEKTGYPPDMLALDLDLEADLGIDTVKQAEMFAAIRAAYDIPRDDQLKLRDFPTLGHAIQFVYDRRPDLKAPATVAAPGPGAAAPPPRTPGVQRTEDPVKVKVMQIVADKTGYPPDMLDLDLDLEADLGIDTVKQAEMFAAIRAAYDIPRDDQLKLRDFPTLAHAIQFVYDRRPDLRQPDVAVTPAPGTPAGEAETAPAMVEDTVKARVLQIIAEKTGYPPDMLDPDLDLEADLGIDTVKQAEMFAAIRAAYDIPRDDQLRLRDFPTLAHAIRFVYDRRPDLAARQAASPAAAAVPASAPAPAAQVPPIVGSMEAANALPRRIPKPYLRPALELCKPTGVCLGEGSRVVIMADAGGVGRALAGRLEKLGVQALLIEEAPETEAMRNLIQAWQARGPIQGVYWLPALDQEGGVAEMDLASWREATRSRVKLLYETTRLLYEDLGKRGAFLVSATRMGGLHGYDDAGAAAPLGGAVCGFTKAFKREKAEALVKVLDFEPSRKTSALADILIDETLRDPGAVEIGYSGGQRWTIGLAEAPVLDGTQGMTLGKDTVFVVTGAAGSIVSAITADLAAASGGIFYLLDLVPEPDPANSDLQRLAVDREGLRRELFDRLKSRGERATPAMVEKEMMALERAGAALSAISAVRASGGTARYFSLNLLDGPAVARVMKQIRDQSGRIDVLVHAAGLEISHLLPDKRPGEFDLVFDVKSDGWFNLMSQMGDMPLGAAVVFSSVAGRFGNAGQTDYSAANDLLCKCISNFRTSRPGTRGIAIDWTAWGGIGMAARGSIPAIMKQAGIDMLSPEAGIPVVRRELTAAGANGEVIIAQRLGIMTREFDETGGLDTSPGGRLAELAGRAGIMAGRVVGMGLYGGLTIETVLDPAKQPFLFDHQINGTPVLPGVMGIEALAETARFLFPDRHIGAVEDVNFHAPFKFYRGQPRTLELHADFDLEDQDIVAWCRLAGTRMLHGHTEPEVTTHFTARVRLVSAAPEPGNSARVPRFSGEKQVAASEIYRLYFHGPAYRVIECSWRAGQDVVGLLASGLPADIEPPDAPVLVSPRLIELCFQTAGLLELTSEQRMGLPYRVDEVRFRGLPNAAKGRLRAVVTPALEGAFAARVIDDRGTVFLALRGYRTMPLPDSVEAELLASIRAALG